MDSNNRVAASAPITLTNPVAPILAFRILKSSGAGASTFAASVSGVKSLADGKLELQSSSNNKDGWVTVGKFTGAFDALKVSALVNLGDYVRVIFSGATSLLDAVSTSQQFLVTPTVVCKISSSGKVGQKLKGTCVSSISLPNISITLQTTTGTVWSVLGSGIVSGTTIPINVTPKKKGYLFVAVTSSGIQGKIGQFASVPVKIKVI